MLARDSRPNKSLLLGEVVVNLFGATRPMRMLVALSEAKMRGLKRDRDDEVDEAKQTVVPTDDGIEKRRGALKLDNLYDARSTRTSSTSSRPR